MQETQVPSLGWEDPLEKEMATHSSTLAWKIHEERNLADYTPWGRKRVRCNLATKQQQQHIHHRYYIKCKVRVSAGFFFMQLNFNITNNTSI